MRVVWAVVVVALFALGFAREARADTLQAPVGGRSVPLGKRVVCGPVSGGWQVDAGGRAVRPPTVASAIGQSVDVKVAAAPEGCATSTETLSLVTTDRWPAIDAGSFVLSLDEGRLEGRGTNLRGVSIAWPTEQGMAIDTCREPKQEAGVDVCTWGVPKTLPADPSASSLRWLPSGARPAEAESFVDDTGRRASPATFLVTPSRVQIAQILPQDASVDVSSGVGVVPLVHPDAISGVECGALRCTEENGHLALQAPPASITSVDVRFTLAPHVTYARKVPKDGQPVVKVAILRCPMTVVSGPVLRGVDSARAIVRLEGGCTQDAASLHFLVGPRRVDIAEMHEAKDATFIVLAVGSVDAGTLSITAVRGEVDAAVVAVARTETRSPPQVRTVLEIPGFPPVDFIPNNREAIVHVPRVAGGELVLLPLDGVYTASNEGGVSKVRGDPHAAGAVALRLAYRVPSLPAPMDDVDLAVFNDPLQRSVREASIPAPIGASASSAKPIVEVVCTTQDGVVHRITPGIADHLSYDARDACRVVFHRERLGEEYGTQKIQLEIEVRKLDGTPRGDGHVSETIILRAGAEPRIAWIKGVAAPYDRVVVRISHVADETHYLGALEIPSGAPAIQWAIVLGTGRFRLYATTAIPTGLYRFGGPSASGVLSLSFGILSRLTWLDSDGHEGILGLEGGVMAFGLTGDVAQTSGQSLTQVGVVVGLGLSIPIANASAPSQAAINLHAWFEQRITGSGPEANSAQAIIFGPSISIGNVGTTF